MGMGSALCGVAYHVFGTTSVYIISAIIWVFIFVYVFETLTYPTSGVNEWYSTKAEKFLVAYSQFGYRNALLSSDDIQET
jgi:hypothetical protein